MEITEVQKKLADVVCPNCSKEGAMQAILICSRQEKRCTTACQCGHCGKPYTVVVPENANEAIDQKMICSIDSSECHFEPIKKVG